MRRVRPLRTVVDTNLFISGSINHRGYPHEVLLAWSRGAFAPIVSPEQRVEIVEVLNRPRICQKYGVSEVEREALLRRIERNAIKVTSHTHLPLPVRDVKDEKILALAFSGHADYLVTGDQDLLVLRDDPRLGGLKILTAREFVAVLEQDNL